MPNRTFASDGSTTAGSTGEQVAASIEDARSAGLRWVSDESPGITRKRAGKNAFAYVGPYGKPVRDEDEMLRIRKLAIPPAWTDVWICPHWNGHIQAVGRDARGRKQYRYHEKWRDVRDENKYGRMMDFVKALPAIRRRVEKDLLRRGLPREKVLAAVVRLLETTFIRVGNDEYAKTNRSYGLTTLRDKHAKVRGSRILFRFRGKSGIGHEIDLQDRRLASIVKKSQDLPGEELFGYEDEDGNPSDVTSGDVNDYLREITGQDFTAKDFRTWAGTVLAARALKEFERVHSQAKRKKNIVAAIEAVAKKLGNTRAVCRKCYIHPALLESYLEGGFIEQAARRARKLAGGMRLGELDPEESAVLVLLQRRLQAEAKKQKAATRRRKAA
jgi:DNA topoisomerase-1